MATPYAEYAKEIQSRLFYGATWTPGTPLRLGQIGTFEKGIFVPKGHLDALRIKFDVERDTRPTSYTCVSQDSVSLKFKAKGESSAAFKSLTDAEAGVAISFASKNTVVFSASKCYEHRVADVLGLQEELAQRLTNGMWQEELAVITHLVEAEAATILLSSSKNTVVELEADASLGQGPTKLGDISAGVAVSYADSMNQLIVALGGITPLFHSLRLKRSFWTGKVTPLLSKGSGTQPASNGPDTKVTRDSFEVVDYDPL